MDTNGAVRLYGREPLLKKPYLLWQGTSGGNRPITVDLSDLSFVGPLDLVGLAAWGTSIRESRRGKILLPEPDVASYMERMNLFELLRKAGWTVPQVKTGPREVLFHKLLEVTALRDAWAVEDMADRLPKLFAGKGGEPRKLRALHFAFGELCDNAASHSDSTPFFVAAQRYTGATSGPPARFELAVADVGIGIPNHLRGNPEYAAVKDDGQTIRLAVRPGISGTRERRGYGFHDILRQAEEVGQGEIIVCSGGGMGLLPFGHPDRRRRFTRLDFAIQGTMIEIRLAE